MTVIEAIKQTISIEGDGVVKTVGTADDGSIIIPVGDSRGNAGYVTEETMVAFFGAQISQELPLSEAQFATLKGTVAGLWEDNWQWYRDNNIIVVT